MKASITLIRKILEDTIDTAIRVVNARNGRLFNQGWIAYITLEADVGLGSKWELKFNGTSRRRN